MTVRAFSYGGGVQSTAALVLAARGEIDFPVFLFSNVGDDSEHPDTIRYVEECAKPYAAAQGIDLIEIRYRNRDGRDRTVYKTLTDPEKPTNIIPLRFEKSGAPGRRACTSDYKARRVAAWLKQHGATRAAPGVVGLGISLDEFQRMKNDSGFATHTVEYPLIDLRLTRQDCINIIENADLPVPPKSSCFFCPFHSISTWQKLKRETPELFARAADLERMLSDKSEARGKGKLFLNRKLIPIEQAIGDQSDMFDEDSCESGYCMV